MLESYGSKEDRRSYWFPWKHRMARQRGLEFGVFIRRHQKWARRLGPTGFAARSSFRNKTAIAKASARPFGPRHSPLSPPLREDTTQMWPCVLAFGASQMHQSPIFRPLDVRFAVSDMMRSTPTMLSVIVEFVNNKVV